MFKLKRHIIFPTQSIFILLITFIPNSTSGFSAIVAPESTPTQRKNIQSIIDEVYGSSNSDQWEKRRAEARSFGLGIRDKSKIIESKSSSTRDDITNHELVYGELGLDALCTILDAVGVRKGDSFMDIGAGDGILVAGASMLYSDYLNSSEGVEIVPDLYHRSIHFKAELERYLNEKNKNSQEVGDGHYCDHHERKEIVKLCPNTILNLGNVYDPEKELQDKFARTSLAVCFATTWSRGCPGRELNQLSEVLGQGGVSELRVGARLVVIDGILNPKRDGFNYEGEMKVYCQDTAPYSVARLYTRI